MIVFVGGIHGVGKTYLGAPAAKHLRIRHATASQLIREERGLQTWGADKRVAGIDENQAALISATARLRTGGQRLLLDGHFVLRGADGSLAEVDVQVFRDLQIGAVLLLATDIEVVLGRLEVTIRGRNRNFDYLPSVKRPTHAWLPPSLAYHLNIWSVLPVKDLWMP